MLIIHSNNLAALACVHFCNKLPETISSNVFQFYNLEPCVTSQIFCVEGSKNSKTGRRAGKPSKMPKRPLTEEAASHTFHKIRAPAKCSECDRYVFNGVECAQCGLSCHNRKCLENLHTPCSHSVSTST